MCHYLNINVRARRFLTQLLKLEFIYRPSRGGINEHFDLTLTEMVDRGIMRCGVA
jgi:hypothetical protein